MALTSRIMNPSTVDLLDKIHLVGGYRNSLLISTDSGRFARSRTKKKGFGVRQLVLSLALVEKSPTKIFMDGEIAVNDEDSPVLLSLGIAHLYCGARQTDRHRFCSFIRFEESFSAPRLAHSARPWSPAVSSDHVS